MGHPPEQTHAIGGYHLLTAKPVLYVANVGEQEASAPCPRFERLAEKVGAQRVLRIAAQIEAEIAQLPPADRAGFLADLGLAETGIDRLIVAAYRLLDLITFYTVAHDRLQAWQVRRGALAPAAAGRIHTEMERGFIRAEVATFADLVRSGSWARLRESGSLRTEGHDYPVADGDVVHFLFKP
jgi:ribosome-binding ATPase YchF (GTP1/OBG family)